MEKAAGLEIWRVAVNILRKQSRGYLSCVSGELTTLSKIPTSCKMLYWVSALALVDMVMNHFEYHKKQGIY
jgi:hypothetical protein